jgi:hypothetical protein
VKRLLLSLALLLGIGGSANAYLCHAPVAPAWPATSWCDWEPQPYEVAYLHPNVRPCGGPPTWGIAQLYSGTNYTGKCAEIWVNSTTTPGYYMLTANYNFVELNGWYSTVNGVLDSEIRSVKIGDAGLSWGGWYTKFTISAGPDIASSSFYRCNFAQYGAGSFDIPDILTTCGNLNGSFPFIASFILEAQ